MTEDRSVFVKTTQVIKTAWVHTDLISMACRDRMDFAAIERWGRRFLQCLPCQIWPPPMGYWQGERFIINDGRHAYLSLLALGQEHIFVAWLEAE